MLQEVIDVLAIAIALRAVLPGPTHARAAPGRATSAPPAGCACEHDAVLPLVEQIRVVADALSRHRPDLSAARALVDRLESELLPHERADEMLLVPMVARALGSTEATAALSRTHAEIEHQVGRLRRLLADIDDAEVTAEDVIELRRLLYGLYAVLRLHNAQEEEGAFALVPEPVGEPGA